MPITWQLAVILFAAALMLVAGFAPLFELGHSDHPHGANEGAVSSRVTRASRTAADQEQTRDSEVVPYESGVARSRAL